MRLVIKHLQISRQLLYNLAMADFQPDNVRSQLERVVNSKAFASSARSGKVLRFLVEETLNGNAGELKEYTIGAQALERGDSFDPRTDPIVRAEASRLRTRLALYYATEVCRCGRSRCPRAVTCRGSRTQNRAKPESTAKITALACAAVAVIALCVLACQRLRPAPLAVRNRLRSGVRSAEVSPDVASRPMAPSKVHRADTNAVARLYTLRLRGKRSGS